MYYLGTSIVNQIFKGYHEDHLILLGIDTFIWYDELVFEIRL